MEEEILSPVQDPFVVSWDSYLPNFQPVILTAASFYRSHYFLLCLELEFNTPFPIRLKGVELESDDMVFDVSSTFIPLNLPVEEINAEVRDYFLICFSLKNFSRK